MNALAWIAFGGELWEHFAGYFLSAWVDERSHSMFPYGTLTVNLTGHCIELEF
jgi:fluoride ion exporter CrcB/FEX